MNISILDKVLYETFPELFEQREISLSQCTILTDNMYSIELGFIPGARKFDDGCGGEEIRIYTNGVFERNLQHSNFRKPFQKFHEPIVKFLDMLNIRFDAEVYSIISVLEVLSLINDDIMVEKLNINKKHDVIIDNNIDLVSMAFQDYEEVYDLMQEGFNYGYELYVQALRGTRFMLLNFLKVYDRYKEEESKVLINTLEISQNAEPDDKIIIYFKGNARMELTINEVRDNGVVCMVDGKDLLFKWYKISRLIKKETTRRTHHIFTKDHSIEYMIRNTNMYDRAMVKNSNGVFSGDITYITKRGINVKTTIDERFVKWCDIVSIIKILGVE